MKTLEQEVLKKIAKKSLFVKLVNTERNESLIEQSISKEFLDLSAVVRVVLKMDKEGMSSMVLSKRAAEILGMTEEEIYAAVLPVPVKTVITGLRDLFLLPPEEETVQEIKDIVSPILATYGDTKLYYDILRTGRKLWISVYITMNRDMISISKFKSVQKEIIQALSKEYQDFYFELLPDIQLDSVDEEKIKAHTEEGD